MSNRIKQLGITPRKSLGQNFLVDDGTAKRIVDAAQIEPNDVVIEIGPGIGALTKHLLKQSHRVIAIELDQTLVTQLQTEYGDHLNLQIVHADALDVDFGEWVQRDQPVRFVSNLPYYITSHAIRKMLECGLNWKSIILTVQLEVAERVIAKPDQMSLLSISVQFYGKPELLFRLSPSAFFPQPDVDSGVIRIFPTITIPDVESQEFFRWVKAGFVQPRKQIRNNISGILGISRGITEDILAKSGITPTRRAETLSVQEWVTLVRNAKDFLT